MNRKHIVLALVALLALVTALPAAPAAAVSTSGAPAGTVYLALGDSYAYGTGASNMEKGGYVPRFYHFLRGDPYGRARELVNLAEGGETSTSFIATQLQPALDEIAEDSDISVVTLDIGGNDLLDLLKPGGACYPPSNPNCMPAAQVALAQLAQNLGYILTALNTALATDPGDETFMLMTYPNPWSGTGDPVMEPLAEVMLFGGDGINCASPTTWGMNDILTCVPTLYFPTTVDVVDIYPSFYGRALELTHIAEGDIHPNDDGHAVIASVFRMVYRGMTQ